MKLLLLLAVAVQLPAVESIVRPQLAYTKTFGGSASEYGTAIAADTTGNVYVAGVTYSQDFPVKGGVQSKIGGTPLRVSADGGKTWTSPAITGPVYSVAGSPKAPGVFYAGTDRALYKSIDAGRTWTALATAPSALMNVLLVDSSNPAVLYAGTSRGMFQSLDAGATWNASSLPARYVTIAAVSPAQPGTVVARLGTDGSPGLYRTTDGGANWVFLSNAPSGVFALTCDPSVPGVFYAGASPNGFNSFARNIAIYKSVDAGTSWSKLIDAPLKISTFTLAAGPNTVYAGTTTGVMRSRDGGVNWTATGLKLPTGNLAIDTNNPLTVYASGAGAVYMSQDGGLTWNIAMPVRQVVETIAVVPGATASVFVGASTGRSLFVTKWSADGKQMIYSTYLGSSYYDYPTAIAVDSQGNAYVAGYTYGTDFPVTNGALQTRTSAAYTGFAAKISADGGKLLYSTYVGGSSGDAIFSEALDGSGNVYLTGYATSDDFPVTPGAFQTRSTTTCDAVTSDGQLPGHAFVTKLNTSGAAAVYSTKLSGGCFDEGFGIAVDGAGSAYVAGSTMSADFPTTKGVLRQAAGEAFLSKLTPQGSGLVWSTILGGDHGTTANAVAVDAKGNPFVTGCDDSGYGGNFGAAVGGNSDLLQVGFGTLCAGSVYALKLNPTASAISYVKYIGGRFGEGSSIAVDNAGRAWVAGSEYPFDTFGTGFPSVHPFQAKMGQGFVSELSADGNDILFSSRVDSAYSMSLDASGNVFLTGFTNPVEKNFVAAPLLARIDAAVTSTLTIEEPYKVNAIPWMTDYGIAPGEVLAVPGTGLGPVDQVNAQIGSDGKLAATLAGASITFDGVAAPLISVQSEQILCIVPFGIKTQAPGGSSLIQVQNGGAKSNSILVATATSATQALALVNQDGRLNSEEQPAKPGSIVTVYAAGLGQTQPPSVDGQINSSAMRTLILGTVRIVIGDIQAEVLYQGPAPGQVAGITQINFRVPQLSPGLYQVAVYLPNGNEEGTLVELNISQ